MLTWGSQANRGRTGRRRRGERRRQRVQRRRTRNRRVDYYDGLAEGHVMLVGDDDASCRTHPGLQLSASAKVECYRILWVFFFDKCITEWSKIPKSLNSAPSEPSNSNPIQKNPPKPLPCRGMLHVTTDLVPPCMKKPVLQP